MTQKSNKILTHPEREEIISKLLNGESVKGIESWLKKRHPRKRRLWVSYATLQKFRKEHLHLEGEVLEDIKAAKKEKDSDSKDLELRAILATSSSYKKKLDEIVSNELDGNRKLLEMITLISSRMEFYFNMIQASPKGTLKEDKMFLELLNTQRGLVQDWKKYVDGVADQKIEHNINLNVVNEQVTVLKSIVFEVLQEMDPTLIPVFVERVNQKLLNTNYGDKHYDQYQKLDVIDA